METDSPAANEGKTTNDLLRAILTVLLDEREARAAEHPGQARSELLLSAAGLKYQTIAQLLGKNPNAVRMVINRASKSINRASKSATSSPGRK